MSLKPIKISYDFENSIRINNMPIANSTGHAVEYSQYTTALSNKADLVGGKVPVSQLPSSTYILDYTNSFLFMGA